MALVILGVTLLMIAILVGWMNADPSGSDLIKILVVVGVWMLFLGILVPPSKMPLMLQL